MCCGFDIVSRLARRILLDPDQLPMAPRTIGESSRRHNLFRRKHQRQPEDITEDNTEIETDKSQDLDGVPFGQRRALYLPE
jgi:hypothetical protein